MPVNPTPPAAPRRFRKVELPAKPGLRIGARAITETLDTVGMFPEDEERRRYLDEQLAAERARERAAKERRQLLLERREARRRATAAPRPAVQPATTEVT